MPFDTDYGVFVSENNHFLANLFKYFKNHYTETPPPAPSQKVRQQNQLASLIKNLNVEQVQKLKKMNEPNPHYTPSDLDNVAHTPSELPFQSRPRVSMSRVGDDKVFFSHTARWCKSEPEYKIITILG